ncbi:DUF1259 domain-containing protein [Streptomyces aureus]
MPIAHISHGFISPWRRSDDDWRQTGGHFPATRAGRCGTGAGAGRGGAGQRSYSVRRDDGQAGDHHRVGLGARSERAGPQRQPAARDDVPHPYPRDDLRVVVEGGIVIKPELALGAHVAFVRYADGGTMCMGDVAVTEKELQGVIDVWQANGIAVTALHKHLPAHRPDMWWVHVHGHGQDEKEELALAKGLRAGFDRTGIPPATPSGPPSPVALDAAGIDAALGAKGSSDGVVYKAVFARRETIFDGHLVLPSGLGATSAFIFQPLGNGRAALSGDCVMLAEEVQNVLGALRRGGIKLVELHNHHLTESPRLFFTHFWAVGDAVELAKALRPAVDATNVVPTSGV